MGVVKPIRREDSCLNCLGLIDEMMRSGPGMENTILAFTLINLAPAVGIAGAGALAGRTSLTTLLNLGRAAGPAAGEGPLFSIN